MSNGIRIHYEFRKVDGEWQRRNIRSGKWLTLHVDRIQHTKLQTRPNGRDPSTTYSPTHSKWTWQ